MPGSSWRNRLSTIRREVAALAVAARHPHVPWYAKGLVVIVVAYALSPIDLVPDFIPILGLLDDLVLVPLGVMLARAWIPSDVMDECRREAALKKARRGAGAWIVAIVIVLA